MGIDGRMIRCGTVRTQLLTRITASATATATGRPSLAASRLSLQSQKQRHRHLHHHHQRIPQRHFSSTSTPVTMAATAAVADLKLTYPETAKGSQVDVYFGEKVSDPYQWLESPDAPETAAWVSAQNKVTQQFLATCPDKAPLEARLKEVYNYERFSCPFKRGDRVFFFRNSGLQNQSVLYKQRGVDGSESVLLDPNTLSADGTAALGTYSVSESGAMLAFGVARSGSDWNTISVMRVEDNQLLEDKVEWVKFSGISWTHDERGFFYSRYPQPEEFAAPTPEQEADPEFKRGTETSTVKNHQVYYHAVGTKQSDDVLVYATPENPEWTVGAEVSDDGRFVILTASESCDTKNRFAVLRLNDDKSFAPGLLAGLVKVVDEFVAEYGYVTNEGPMFFFRTNHSAGRYKLVAFDVTAAGVGTQPDQWRTVIPEHGKDVLESVSAVHGDKLVAVHSRDVAEKMSLYAQDGSLLQADVPLPDVGSISGLAARKDDAEFFYHFSSFLYAGIIMRADLSQSAGGAGANANSGADSASASASAVVQSVFREIQVSGFDARAFETKQVFVDSKDGAVKIPMFIVHRKGLQLDGNNPTWLYGYGGFNISLPPSFSVARVVWMQHFGGVFACANIRGGGEYGEAWYKGGVQLRKQNCFDDFCAAAEFLHTAAYTRPAKLAINGGSNGGLLVAACLNQRPELFGAVIGQVGVLDLLKYHKWTIGYAWASDYGTSEQSAEMFAYLRKISPVHNVRSDVPYPALLLCTSDHDDRVVPLHSYKYIAGVQATVAHHPQQTQPLLIRIEEKAGHGAGLPLSKRIVEQADTIAFMAKVLGAKSDFQQ